MGKKYWKISRNFDLWELMESIGNSHKYFLANSRKKFPLFPINFHYFSHKLENGKTDRFRDKLFPINSHYFSHKWENGKTYRFGSIFVPLFPINYHYFWKITKTKGFGQYFFPIISHKFPLLFP